MTVFEIPEPVNSVMLMGNANSSANMSMDMMDMGSSALIFHENQDGLLACRSEGGVPAPALTVMIGEQRISGMSKKSTSV